jgi:hypothetical protein
VRYAPEQWEAFEKWENVAVAVAMVPTAAGERPAGSECDCAAGLQVLCEARCVAVGACKAVAVAQE